jgi:hypothetical protein
MPYLGEVSALVTAGFWSFSAIVLSAAIVRAGAIPVNVGRLVLAALYLAVLIPVMGPMSASRPARRACSRSAG